jgi:predicted secreted protein
MYWTGSSLVKGKSGWLSTPLTGVGRKGRQLTPQAPGSKVLRVGEAENRREIAVHVGTEISIGLPGTRVTGHSWKISKTNGTSVQLLSRRPTYVADPGRSGRASVGGTFTFKLKAVKAGRTVVECAYGKGVSAYGRPERTFTVTFVVR